MGQRKEAAIPKVNQERPTERANTEPDCSVGKSTGDDTALKRNMGFSPTLCSTSNNEKQAIPTYILVLNVASRCLAPGLFVAGRLRIGCCTIAGIETGRSCDCFRNRREVVYAARIRRREKY